MIEAFPKADISVSIVWIKIGQGDSEETAHEATETISDPHVRHFYDPEQRSGKAIAQSLALEGRVAWDIYLFYAKDSEWTDSPPTPRQWMHQLSASEADSAHFHTGDDLVEELYKTMKRLVDI